MTIGVTVAECVVASVVAMVVVSGTGGRALMLVGPSREDVVGGAVLDVCSVMDVVVR